MDLIPTYSLRPNGIQRDCRGSRSVGSSKSHLVEKMNGHVDKSLTCQQIISKVEFNKLHTPLSYHSLCQVLLHQAPSRLAVQLRGFDVCSLDIVIFLGYLLRCIIIRELIDQ